jgi:hypothetical protein
VSPSVAADADGECKRSECSREPMPHIDVGDKVVQTLIGCPSPNGQDQLHALALIPAPIFLAPRDHQQCAPNTGPELAGWLSYGVGRWC